MASRLSTLLTALSHDWRIRTLVPVAAIHVVAFGLLYVEIWRAAREQIVDVYEARYDDILDESLEVFSTRVAAHGMFATAHGQTSVRARLAQVSRQHGNSPIHLFDVGGKVVWSAGPTPEPSLVRDVNNAVVALPRQRQWKLHHEHGGYSLVGVSLLRNDETCQGCHGQALPLLGAIGMNEDLTPVLSSTQSWVRNSALVLAVSWVTLSMAMSFLRGFVIGRPIARIEEQLKVMRPDQELPPQADLDTLAQRLHETIWGLLENEKRRRADVTRQMARAEQMAALGTVAAGLSHEIKNPLAGIRTAVEVLSKEEDPNGERLSIFKQIVAELDRVTRTVENLLRLARPQKLSRMPAKLEQIARNAATLLDPQLRQRSIELDVAVTGTIPTLELDSSLIMQILLNLINNAAEAVGNGGHVKVEIAPFPQNDGALLSVSDDGAGIPRETIERVFEPFYTTKATGTGLGLPLCRQMVEQHGGTMSIESAPGKGTRVVALFPAAHSTEER